MLLVYYTQKLRFMREEGMFMFGIYYYYRNLILLAVVPAIILLVKVYQKDKVEKESPKMLVTLIMCGYYTLLALLAAIAGDWVLQSFLSENSLVYHLITCMIIVAYAEEGSKYIMLKLRTWKSIEFNCLYGWNVVCCVHFSLALQCWRILVIPSVMDGGQR